MAQITRQISKTLFSAEKSQSAIRRHTVSTLDSDFVVVISEHQQASETQLEHLLPNTRQLLGCIAETDEDIETYIDYLEKKHA